MSIDTTPVIYAPRSRYTSKTPVLDPLLVPFIQGAAIMGLEWTTLDFIEKAPLLVRVATFVIALCALAVIRRREWLNFKGRYWFTGLLGALATAYVGTLAFAYSNAWIETPVAATAPTDVPKPISAGLPPPVKPLSDDEKQFRFSLRTFVLSDLQDQQNAMGTTVFNLINQDSNTIFVKGPEITQAAAGLLEPSFRLLYPSFEALSKEANRPIEEMDTKKIVQAMQTYFTAYNQAQIYFQDYLTITGQDLTNASKDPNKNAELSRWLSVDSHAANDLRSLQTFPSSEASNITHIGFPGAATRFGRYLQNVPGSSP